MKFLSKTIYFLAPVLIFLAFVIPAQAYFSDPEVPATVNYQTSTLEIQADETNNFTTLLTGNTTLDQTVTLTSLGDAATQYTMTVAEPFGNLCDVLQITANWNAGEPEYQGWLKDFTTAPLLLGGATDTWYLAYAVMPGQNLPASESCEFKIDILAWQSDFPEFTGQGFSHHLTLTAIITSSAPEPPPDDKSIIINEIMWMGSTASQDDTWIELRNTTGQPIDIRGWTLENVRNSNRLLEILPPSNTVIPPFSLFLISHRPPADPSSALRVKSHLIQPDLTFHWLDQSTIILRDPDGKIIDEVSTNPWPTGIDNATKHSMQRLDTPNNGLQADNWSSCVDEACNDIRYWKTEGGNYGTPNSGNLFGQELPGRGNITIIDTALTNSAIP